MKEKEYLPAGAEDIQDRLWDYIDGLCTAEERITIEKLLQTNISWQEKFNELLELQRLMQSTELEVPSMRFAKNVMEEIARHQIAPATKTYINKKIIWGIGLFFMAMITGALIYTFMQVDWSSNGKTNLPIDLSKVDFSKVFNNTYITIFMMVNVVLGLMLLDRFLANRRKDA